MFADDTNISASAESVDELEEKLNIKVPQTEKFFFSLSKVLI
jgi:hypothetical protein